MCFRSTLSATALALALAMTSSVAKAHDEAKYPNWKGQWRVVLTPGLEGQRVAKGGQDQPIHPPIGRPVCRQPVAHVQPILGKRARELLETTGEPIENIDRLTGLGAPASVRAAFHRRVGTSPQAYRSIFHR